MLKAILDLEKMPEHCYKCKLLVLDEWTYDKDNIASVPVCVFLSKEAPYEGRRPDCPLKLVDENEE